MRRTKKKEKKAVFFNQRSLNHVWCCLPTNDNSSGGAARRRHSVAHINIVFTVGSGGSHKTPPIGRLSEETRAGPSVVNKRAVANPVRPFIVINYRASC